MSGTAPDNADGWGRLLMLVLAKITKASAGGYAAYLEGKARASELGDYYLKDGERTGAPERWVQGAELFGLSGEAVVSGEQLHTLMAVRRPDTGQLLRRSGGSGEAVSAIDATFSAPKSVSAIWALAGPELRQRIEAAHETAIDRALGYAIEQVPMLRRRVAQDTVVHEHASGLIATSWRHTTARAVAQQVPDPQLHSHVLLHAAVRADGQVVAIDSRTWLVHQREIGAAYRTELAHELQALGFTVRRGTGRGGRYFELDGVPQPLIDRWSSRHQQVQAAIQQRLNDRQQELERAVAGGGAEAGDAATELELLREHRQLSPAQERMMGTITRSAKLPVTIQDLDAEWVHTAARLGLSPERVQVLQHRAPDPLPVATGRAVLDALTEFDATFTPAQARAVALERSTGVPVQAALQRLQQLRDSEQILPLADGSGTTRAHRARERTVVAIADTLAASQVAAIPGTLVAKETDQLDHELAGAGGRLSDEQRQAITLACGDRQLVIIEGQAGTGKSTTLTGITRAHQAAGQQIIVTSTAALAAQRLANELRGGGVSCDAYSTAALEAAVNGGKVVLSERITIVHDEAALASTREQAALLQAVQDGSARLIAVGDPKQNQPVGAGGLWNHIEQATRDAEAHVELTRNQRAKDPADRRAQELFREGHVERAIRNYAARGHVHLHEDQRRAEDHALEAAHADRAAGKSTIVIAQTSNQHLDELNARAQAIRIQAGELGEDSIPVPGRPYELRQGDLVQVRRTLRLDNCEALRNGTGAEVAAISVDSRAIDLRIGDDEIIQLTARQISDADLRLGYVQHPFPAQGKTVDFAHLVVSEYTTREGSYVGLTRARQATDIYAARSAAPDTEADRLQDLAAHMNRSEPELPSITMPLTHVSESKQLVESRPLDRNAARDANRYKAHATSERTSTTSTANKVAPGLDAADGLNGPAEGRGSGHRLARNTGNAERTWAHARSDGTSSRTDGRRPDLDQTNGFEL